MQESATAEPNSVLQVIQKGYELNGRLLRPARVIVAKAPGCSLKRRAARPITAQQFAHASFQELKQSWQR